MTTKIASALVTAVAAAAILVTGCASAATKAPATSTTETAATTSGGAVHFIGYSKNSDGPDFTVILTGKVGDYGPAVTVHGGTVLDPEVVRQLLRASRRADSLRDLTPREADVLCLIAQGRSNNAIAAALFISPGVVEKHVASVFAKLGLAQSDNDNRRVLAAVTYLQS
jgi:DNA-binding CsgD family transcriptional regulator